MPIAKDAETGLLKFARALPANGFGMSVLQFFQKLPSDKLPSGVSRRTVQIPRRDGGSIRTLVIAPDAPAGPLPIVVHFHGGGYIVGTPEASLNRARMIQEAAPCIMLMPAFRLARGELFPASHDDCYDALLWATENAGELGGSADRIAIGGESAGGGLTLSTALRARDEGKVKPVFMFPIYPMIEDREERWTKVPERDQSWNLPYNRLGWDRLLGAGRRGGDDVSVLEAPARNTHWADLPPALSFVGDCDLFLDETRVMIEGLRGAGGAVTYKEFPNAYHGHELFAPKTDVGQKIANFYRQGFRQMVQTYC